MANSEQSASGEPDDHLARAIAMDAICDFLDEYSDTHLMTA